MEDRDPFAVMLDAPPLSAVPEYQPPADFVQAERGKKLEILTDMALERAHEILAERNAVGKNADRQLSTIKTVLQAQLRADEAKLQDKVRDTLGELVKMMKEEEAKRAITQSLEDLAQPAARLQPNGTAASHQN